MVVFLAPKHLYIHSVYYEEAQQFEYLSVIEIISQIKGGVTIKKKISYYFEIFP